MFHSRALMVVVARADGLYLRARVDDTEYVFAPSNASVPEPEMSCEHAMSCPVAASVDAAVFPYPVIKGIPVILGHCDLIKTVVFAGLLCAGPLACLL